MKSMLSGLISGLNITFESGLFSKRTSDSQMCKILREEWNDGRAPKTFNMENPELLSFSLYGKIL